MWTVVVKLLVVEEEWGEGFAHMPFHVVCKHAQKDVCGDVFLCVVSDGADSDVESFEAAEGALDGGEAFVVAHGVCGVHGGGRFACADDVYAVELFFF